MKVLTNWLEQQFRLTEHGTNVRTEALAGITTFLTMCYIIFVNPIILSHAFKNSGVPEHQLETYRNAVMAATCLCSAIPSILMAFLANYPIAGAPGMGHNALFSFWVCGSIAAGGLGLSWQEGFACVFLSGALFVALSNVGFREALVDAVPDSLKHAIAVGIGLFITLIGMEWGGIIVDSPATLVRLGVFSRSETWVCLIGLVTMICCLALQIRASILIGLVVTCILGIVMGITDFKGITTLPPSFSPTAFKLTFRPLIDRGLELIIVVFILFLLDVFDTVGTLIGVSSQAGLLKNGKLPKARQALLSDAVGTVAAGLLGSSTVTAYIESATGVQAGGRTGLTSLVTGILMLFGLFFSPLVEMLSVPANFGGLIGHPLIAPALIIVGAFMMKGVRFIRWDDLTESVSAFLTIVIIPFGFSISDGIAFGFIAYSILSLITKQGRQVHWLIYLFALIFTLRYLYEAIW